MSPYTIQLVLHRLGAGILGVCPTVVFKVSGIIKNFGYSEKFLFKLMRRPVKFESYPRVQVCFFMSIERTIHHTSVNISKNDIVLSSIQMWQLTLRPIRDDATAARGPGTDRYGQSAGGWSFFFFLITSDY